MSSINMERKGFYAFRMIRKIANKNIKKTFYEHEKCGLIEIIYHQDNYPMHVIPKRSPFKFRLIFQLFIHFLFITKGYYYYFFIRNLTHFNY